MVNRNTAVATGLLLLTAFSGVASAANLTLTCSVLAADPNSESTACPVNAPSYAVPEQYNYVQSFQGNEAGGVVAGSNIYGGPSYGFLGPAGFIDDYFFQITSATADVVSATINLGGVFSISNLFARIYSLAANPGGLVTTTPNGLVYYGAIISSGPATFIQINPIALTAGSYVLEISGTRDGSSGGSYTGTLNLSSSAVPLPATLPLLLAGIGALGAAARRRWQLTPAQHA